MFSMKIFFFGILWFLVLNTLDFISLSFSLSCMSVYAWKLFSFFVIFIYSLVMTYNISPTWGYSYFMDVVIVMMVVWNNLW